MEKISSFPEKLSSSLRSEVLRTNDPALRALQLFGFQKVSSTMDISSAVATAALPLPSLAQFRLGGSDSNLNRNSEFAFVALSQTDGRGRKQRQWLSVEGRGIYVTFLFLTTAKTEELSGLSLAMGLAVQSVGKQFGAQCFLKWPNDVLALLPGGAEKRKLSGILVDVGPAEILSATKAIHVGIGLNLGRQIFPHSIPAVSLEEVLGRLPRYEEVLLSLCREVLQTKKRFFEEGFTPLASEWNSVSGQIGEKVSVELGHGDCREGVVLGVGTDGSLRLKDESSGENLTIYSGEVQAR